MKTFCPLPQVGDLDQRLPGGQADQRDGGRFRHRELPRLRRQVVFVDGDELREGADPVLVRSRVDLVAWLELPHPRPDPDHDTGHVVAQDERRAIGQDELELPVPDLGVQGVDARGVDLDQHVVLAHLGLRHLAGPKAAAASVAVDDECPHVSPPSG